MFLLRVRPDVTVAGSQPRSALGCCIGFNQREKVRGHRMKSKHLSHFCFMFQETVSDPDF